MNNQHFYYVLEYTLNVNWEITGLHPEQTDSQVSDIKANRMAGQPGVSVM